MSVSAIHLFTDLDGKIRSKSPTIPIAHRAAAYSERFNSRTIITIKSAKRNGLQKPLFVFSNEDFALSQADGNKLTLSIEGQDKFYILTFDDDKQALQFHDQFAVFAYTESKVLTPRDVSRI